MSRIREAMLPLALAGAIAGGAPDAGAGELSVREQHVKYCVDLYSGASDNMVNGAKDENGKPVPGHDGKPDGLPTEKNDGVGYGFILNAAETKINRVEFTINPQNLEQEFDSCNDVAIERKVVGSVFDRRGKTILLIAQKTIELDAQGTPQKETVRPRRQLREGGSNYARFITIASGEGYSSSSTVRTGSTNNFEENKK